VEQAIDRAQGGLGVGLTLVKRLVELHGGRVEARSAGPGTGSEFVIGLPMMQGAAVRIADFRDGQMATAPAPLRVLVVDDSADSPESLGTRRDLRGHEVRRAHAGQRALPTGDVFRPDVIVLALGMPGMDGCEVARRIRDRDEGGPLLVALTGYGRDEDRS